MKTLRNTKEKTAVVTGAAGHLGRMICDTLAELGTNLILLDIDDYELSKLKMDIEDQWKVNCSAITCNLENEVDRNSAIKLIKSNVEGINCLINNAAFVGDTNLDGWAVPFADQSLETWRRAMEVNLTAPFHFSRDLFSQTEKKGSGVIVNISSIYASLGPDWSLYNGTSMGNPAAYSASKAGLEQLTRWMATTLAPDIRVNAIAPGGIFRNQPQEFITKYVDKTPLRKMANEDDFKGVIKFLCTDMSNYMTGQVLTVDGGLSIK